MVAQNCNFITLQIKLDILRQEAPLTLRGQRGRCRNLKGNPKYLGAFIAQGQAHFSSGCGFVVCLGKLQANAKLEVASPSRCRNIIE